MLKKLVHSRVWISLAALSMACMTTIYAQNKFPHWSVAAYIFFATLFAYNIYYIGNKHPEYSWHKQTAILGLILAVVSFLFIPDKNWFTISVLGILGSIYIFPEYIPFKIFKHSLVKIIILTLVWVMAICYFPLGNKIPSNIFFLLFVFSQFIFIFILNYLFDIKDIEFDKDAEKKSLAVKFGERTSYRVVYGLCILFSALNIYIYYLTHDSIFCDLAIFALPNLLIAILLFISIHQSKKTNNIFPYLLYVDGLMLLQGLLVILSHLVISLD